MLNSLKATFTKGMVLNIDCLESNSLRTEKNTGRGCYSAWFDLWAHSRTIHSIQGDGVISQHILARLNYPEGRKSSKISMLKNNNLFLTPKLVCHWINGGTSLCHLQSQTQTDWMASIWHIYNVTNGRESQHTTHWLTRQDTYHLCTYIIGQMSPWPNQMLEQGSVTFYREK